MNNLLGYMKRCGEDHSTECNALTFAVGTVGFIYLLKGLYSLQHSYRYKYPEAIKSSEKFAQTLGNTPEKALLALARAHPDQCTLSFRSWFGLRQKHVIILNSMEAVQKFTRQAEKADSIANRPKNIILATISKNYLGSFFRMNDEKVVEVS